MMKGIGDTFTMLAARLLLRGIAATWRFREEPPDDCRPILDGREPAVVAFWHGKMLPAWYRFRGGGSVALVSASRDGEILARYLERSLGYSVIRGSSSRKGGEALGAMVAELQVRSCLLTPDGPHGPARQAKPGMLVASIRSGCPLMLVGWRATRSWRVRSWDAMEIPWPFARVEVRYRRIEMPPGGEGQRWIEEEELKAIGEILTGLSHS